jgi:Flp pilus assembly protein TadD
MHRAALALVAVMPLAAATAADLPSDAGRYVPDIASDAAIEGNEAFAEGDLERARTAYTRVLELVPGNLVGLVNLGVVEFKSGNLARAEELLREAVRTRIETAPAWLTLGIIYMDQGRLNEALAALTQATLYDPGNPRARNYLGVVIGRKGWLDGAQSELRKAVEIDPAYSDAHFNLAFFYLERKPPLVELARRHYLRSIELGAEPDKEIETEIEKLLGASQAKSP